MYFYNDSPANLDALLEDEEDERTSKAASRSGSFISAVSDQDFPDDEADMVGMDMDDLGLVNLHMQGGYSVLSRDLRHWRENSP